MTIPEVYLGRLVLQRRVENNSPESPLSSSGQLDDVDLASTSSGEEIWSDVNVPEDVTDVLSVKRSNKFKVEEDYATTPLPTVDPDYYRLARELAGEPDWEAIYIPEGGECEEIPPPGSRSVLRPLATAVGCALSTVEEINRLTKPGQERVIDSAAAVVGYVGQTIHDTGMDVVDSAVGVDWLKGAQTVATGVGGTLVSAAKAGVTGLKVLAETPLAKRFSGAVRKVATEAALGVVVGSQSVLEGVKRRVDDSVNSLDARNRYLSGLLNPNGLPAGEVVPLDDDMLSDDSSIDDADEE